MNGRITKLSYLLIIPVVCYVYGCAGENYGKLRRTDQPSDKELRQNWRAYTVFHNSGSALLYKISNDRKIVLSSSWVAVTDADMMAKSKIFDFTQVVEIFAQNDELYGYLVHDYDDMANVKIIDERTIRLYYHRTRKGGP